jgi:hypothetical protein
VADLSQGVEFEPDLGFSVGNVTERGFALFGRHFGKFLILLLIPCGPALLLKWADSAIKADAVGGKLGANPTEALTLSLGVLALTFVFLVLTVVTQAAITLAAFQALQGVPVSVTASLRAGLARFWALVGLVILEGIGFVFGLVLLVVPALFLITIWYVAMPACLIERLGPTASLRRSAALSKGYRWKLFGIILLVFITFALAGGMVIAIASVTGNQIVAAVVRSLAQTVSATLGAIFAAVIFHDLRVMKEGHDTDRIAGVFN